MPNDKEDYLADPVPLATKQVTVTGLNYGVKFVSVAVRLFDANGDLITENGNPAHTGTFSLEVRSKASQRFQAFGDPVDAATIVDWQPQLSGTEVRVTLVGGAGFTTWTVAADCAA